MVDHIIPTKKEYMFDTFFKAQFSIKDVPEDLINTITTMEYNSKGYIHRYYIETNR
jgi:hypothetical protein